jgi:hypothetical protein
LKSRRVLFLVFFAVVIASAIAMSMVFRSHEERNEYPVVTPFANSFALIELFTSEGCSSCPAADKLLAEMYAEYRKKNQPVFTLAFHVDYWDDLGWKDEFSKRSFSQRQSRYGEVFKLSSIYTPQMVINGSTEFVGSDRTRSRESIQSALSKSVPINIVLSHPALANQSLTLGYSLSDIPSGTDLNFALVERGITHNVLRGENGGRKLNHENVVRVFKTIRPDHSGEFTLELPSDVKVSNSSVVAYLQKTETMEVLGAANVDLTDTMQDKN